VLRKGDFLRYNIIFVMKNFFWHLPTEIVFGAGALSHLKVKAPKFGRKALVVTGKKFARETGLLDEIKSLLSEGGVAVEIFAGANENPTTGIIMEGTKICQEKGCDFVVGVGGGSAMDTAKGIAILITNPGGLQAYFGTDRIINTPLPVIAIPTTAGSGSEVTRYAVIVDQNDGLKKTVSSVSICPKLALVQPSLTLSLSSFLTASTGLDAFCHAVEGGLSQRITPLTLVLAKGSVEIIKKALPCAVSDLTNIEAREKMSLAALMSGMVINQTGTIIGHGMGYPLTLNYRVQHGSASSLVLPAIFEFLAKKGFTKRITEITGWKEPALAWKEFCQRIGLPTSLKEVGVKKEELEDLAREGFRNSQRSIENLGLKLKEEDLYEIYCGAF